MNINPHISLPLADNAHFVRLDIAISIVGTLSLGLAIGWYLISPLISYVHIIAVLISLVFITVGWLGLLMAPPKGFGTALIVVAYCMTDFSIRRGGVEPGDFDIQSMAKGGIWCILLIFGLVHGAPHVSKDRVLTVFGFYALFAFISAFYSPAFGLGIGSGIALLALAAYAGHISNWALPRVSSMWFSLFVMLSVMASVSILLYFLLPDWARDYKAAGAGRLRGLTGSGNALGPLMAVATIIGLYCLRISASKAAKAAVFALIIADLAALALTQSRSSMIGLLAGIALAAALARKQLLPIFGAIFVIGVWISLNPDLLHQALTMVAQLVSRTGNVYEISSMTGRSNIWSAVIDIWKGSPWIGFGLGSPRLLISQAHISRWQTYESAHNWVLESLLNFGVLGTGLLVAFIAVLAAKIWGLFSCGIRKPVAQREGHDWLALCLMRLLIFALVSGITEKAFAGMPSPTTVLLAMVAASTVVCIKTSTYSTR